MSRMGSVHEHSRDAVSLVVVTACLYPNRTKSIVNIFETFLFLS